MKRIYLSSAPVLLFIALFACNERQGCIEPAMLVPCKEDSSMVNIRIRNVSKYNFCNVLFNPGSYTAYYGSVPQGDLTCYQPFAEAYAIPGITLSIQEKKFILQPLDVVDAIPLEKGRYTCSVNVTNFSEGVLKIETTKE